MHNRLKQFLAAENITQALFAETIGIGKANISHVLSGRNKPGYDFITAIMRGYPQLNINWLMLGTEKMYNTSETERRPEKERDTTLLFSAEEFTDEDLPPVDIPENHYPVEDLPQEELPAGRTLPETVQTVVKQRNVSKIIVLFDDGTYQEM